MSLVRVGCLAVLLLAACGTRPAPSGGPGPSPLGSDLARVGVVSLAPSLVIDVARARSESPARALSDVVEDALAAVAAQSGGVDRSSRATWPIDVALARRAALQAMADAREQGPPTTEELEELAVVHAIVIRSARVPEGRAIAVAGAIRQAVDGAPDADAFEARARATPHADSQVLVEHLAPFGADGRASSAEYDASFVAAAFALRRAAQISPVVETRFGWHVIFLVARSMPEGASLDGRRADLADAVESMRARGLVESRLRARRQTARIEVLGAADALMATVKGP